jgi:hypothetical protein
MLPSDYEAQMKSKNVVTAHQLQHLDRPKFRTEAARTYALAYLRCEHLTVSAGPVSAPQWNRLRLAIGCYFSIGPVCLF